MESHLRVRVDSNTFNRFLNSKFNFSKKNSATPAWPDIYSIEEIEEMD